MIFIGTRVAKKLTKSSVIVAILSFYDLQI